jgi:hypothetical protein
MDKLKETYTSIGSTAKTRSIGSALLIILYVYGLVIVKGFWAMAVAIIVPIYSWYLAIEQLAKYFGLGV